MLCDTFIQRDIQFLVGYMCVIDEEVYSRKKTADVKVLRQNFKTGRPI